MLDRRGRELSPEFLTQDIQTGTHAMGGYGGTITFPRAFSGTPVVMLTPIAGSIGAIGSLTAYVTPQTIPLATTGRFSGSFTYRGSPGAGTFDWAAIGPRR